MLLEALTLALAPSNVSASKPLPEPSTVFILVNKSDADNLAAVKVPVVKSAA